MWYGEVGVGGRVGVGVVHMSSQKGADGSTYKDLAEC